MRQNNLKTKSIESEHDFSKMADIFTECLLTDKVSLSAIMLNENFNDRILRVLKERYEAKCSCHGYIRRNSIKIFKIGAGHVQMVSLNGDVCFAVEFTADVCLPVVGCIVKATVKNMNRFGVLCDVTRDKDTIMEIIIAKNSSELKSELNLDDLKIGDAVNVEIMGRKFEINDKKISIIGRVVVNCKTDRVVQRVQCLSMVDTLNQDAEKTIESDVDEDDTEEESASADEEDEESEMESEENDEEDEEEDEENEDEEVENEEIEEDDGSETASDSSDGMSDSEEF